MRKYFGGLGVWIWRLGFRDRVRPWKSNMYSNVNCSSRLALLTRGVYPPQFRIPKIWVREGLGATTHRSSYTDQIIVWGLDLFEIFDFQNFWFGHLLQMALSF